MSLSREDILNAIDLELREISVPEWGGTVYLRNLSGSERDEMEIKFREAADNPQIFVGIRAYVLSLVLCDEQRYRLFTSTEDVERLGEKNAAVLDRLFEIALDMNAIGEAAIEDAKKN